MKRCLSAILLLLMSNTLHPNENLSLEKESSTRHAEVVFFVAFPFVLLSHFAVTGGIYAAGTGDSSFNSFPVELTVFNLFSATFLSGFIAYDSIRPPSLQNQEDHTHEARWQFQWGVRF